MTCRKTSDNLNFECPAKMSDGRIFTDYRPSCDVEHALYNSNALRNSFEYRTFLTNNAQTIMQYNLQQSNELACGSYCEEVPIPAPQWVQKCDKYSCEIKASSAAADGLGLLNASSTLSSPPPSKPAPSVQKNVCTTHCDNVFK